MNNTMEVDMKKWYLAIALLILISQPVIAIEGDSKGSPATSFPESALVEFLIGDMRQAPDADTRRSRLQQGLRLQEAIISEASRLKLTGRQDVQAKVELARRQAIVEAYWLDFFRRNPIPESALKNAYGKLVEANGNRQYRLSHILVKDDAAAQKVLDELKRANSSFSTVAKNISLDEATRLKGGELGWHWKTEIVPFVAEKLNNLKPGDLIGPWQTAKDMMTIVKFEESREQNFPDFDKLKPQLEKSLRQQMEQQELARLGKQPR